MTTDTKRIIIYALQRYRGDSLERAKAAFRGLTPEQMKLPHGQSGEARQQILDGYQNHVDAVNSARAEVDAL